VPTSKGEGREGKGEREGRGWGGKERREGRGGREGEGRLASQTIFRPYVHVHIHNVMFIAFILF